MQEQKDIVKILQIVPLTPRHVDALFEHLSDPGLYPFASWDIPETVEVLRKKIETVGLLGSTQEEGFRLSWVATTKTSDENYCGCLEVLIVGQQAYLTCYTFKAFQKMGYAKEAVKAIIAELERVYNLDAVVFHVNMRNIAAVRLAEGLNFECVGADDQTSTLRPHDFRFEKKIYPQCRLLSNKDVADYVRFRQPNRPEEELKDETSHLMRHFKDFVSENERVYLCVDVDGIVGAACLLKFQEGIFGIGNMSKASKDNYDKYFACILSKLVLDVKGRNARKLELRLVETARGIRDIACLQKAGFRQKYHRSEFKRLISQLPVDMETPFSWRSIPDLSDTSLEYFAMLMSRASEGDPDFDPKDDALECIKGYLQENKLTCDTECFHIGSINGEDSAILIAQINKQSGWSRITYMGLLPRHRGKGLGKWVHRHGFAMIKKQGGIYYQGGTLSNNSPMIRLFEMHGCEKFRTLQGWELDF